METNEMLRLLAQEIDELLYQSDPQDYEIGNGLEPISREQNIERIYQSILYGQQKEHERILLTIAEDMPLLREQALFLRQKLTQINKDEPLKETEYQIHDTDHYRSLENIVRERYDPSAEDEVGFSKMKHILSDLMKKDYQNFCKALFAIEFYLEDECLLDEMYSEYISNDHLALLHSGFDQLLQNYYAKVEERFGKITEVISDSQSQKIKCKVLDLTTGEIFIAQADDSNTYKVNQAYIFVGEERTSDQGNLYQIISAVRADIPQVNQKSIERELE